ncbi:SDR family NAD(P)-dependent oxidoreductase [Halorientalis pallida]|uniref:SDR family NAD(P)-dependent oxidoreductase n=1 Tax=Halorientalis pallida TaxID=2479928 RepID=A0A498KVP8_9EURY|nr:SDR family NAD(P)-dependent oxidoreductase [Halorientalis pallida]RXK48669.1 SDR family NAD(P)-dependent oxidoreductase [Halorientalis pallida]
MTRTVLERAGVTERDLTGSTALVTGSTSGIGREAALALGDLGADVIVHGRDEGAGEEVVDDLTARGSDAAFVRADFASVEAVRDLAETVRERTDTLDVLVNNAGGFFSEGRTTDLGVEYTFHVNHLSPYLLTAELVDLVPDGGRIVTTASAAHRGGSLDLGAIESTDGYSGMLAYSRSKLANVLFAFELDRRLDRHGRDVTANAVHPGAIPGSNFARFLPGPLPRLVGLLGGLPFVTDVEDGAAALVHVAAAERTAHVSGRYFDQQEPTTPAAAARDPDTQRRLWTESAALLGIDEPLAEE